MKATATKATKTARVTAKTNAPTKRAKAAKLVRPPKAAGAEPPFAFVGAGAASYFEWAEVHVRFERAPTPKERKAISAGVPMPLRDSIDFNGAHLAVASAQGVGRLIKSTYGKGAKPPSKLTAQSRFAQGSSSDDARFDADTERWLHDAHGIVPVLVAFRRQDSEAGGTKLSDWHDVSVRKVPALLQRIASEAKGKAPPESYLARGIASEAAAAKIAVPKGALAKFVNE